MTKYYSEAAFLNTDIRANLPEEVARFMELFSVSANNEYALRLLINLSWILWLDSECKRLLSYSHTTWFYAFYDMGYSFLDVHRG